MTNKDMLPIEDQHASAAGVRKRPRRTIADAQPAACKRRSTTAEGLVPLMKAFGAVSVLIALGSGMWLLSDLGRNTPTDLATAERACSRALMRHSSLPQNATITISEAIGTTGSWRIAGYAMVEGSGVAMKFDWSCAYYMNLGTSRVLAFHQAELEETAPPTVGVWPLSLLPEISL